MDPIHNRSNPLSIVKMLSEILSKDEEHGTDSSSASKPAPGMSIGELLSKMPEMVARHTVWNLAYATVTDARQYRARLDSELLHLLQTNPSAFEELRSALQLLEKRLDVALLSDAAITRVRDDYDDENGTDDPATVNGGEPAARFGGDESWMLGKY